MKIVCVGINYTTSNLSEREKFFTSIKDAYENLSKIKEIKENDRWDEFIFLSTCNRIEVYAVYLGKYLEKDQLKELMQHVLNHAFEDFDLNFYTYQQEKAIDHLFRVVASLDSLVLGETQITSQFKEAIKHSLEAKTLGPVLSRLAQAALFVNKKVRSHTGLSKLKISMGHIAIDVSKRIFSDLSKKTFLFIGSGEMAEISLKYALTYKPKEVLIANRTLEHAKDLCLKVGKGLAYELKDLPKLLHKADIVITSTGATGFIIDQKMLNSVMQKRAQHAMYICDLAFPRDVDPLCAELEEVFLFSIDELAQIAEENKTKRSEAALAAEGFLDEATEVFMKWFQTRKMQPIYLDYKKYVENLIDREAEKTLSKNIFSDLTPEQKMGLEKLFLSISSKLTSDVVINLKKLNQ